ncbi:MAG: hypothetical protein VW950_03565 [Rhodobiaceae bacterium]
MDKLLTEKTGKKNSPAAVATEAMGMMTTSMKKPFFACQIHGKLLEARASVKPLKKESRD